ncbi:RNase adapter RapZ [Thalassobaculum sp. OXR-137]|uniref:RNase adapter RapZ n=1 Tax=Thalassobaculum sp. OXR-137 TaxID=3100173 RepID=UPI002AC992CB|nr:RNase adapter RapZ [Thalassobaculum sp. OXR-137]WPZ35997.1 RNase adapter RapZ [Thalassobaculum sp. OXR-137]
MTAPLSVVLVTGLSGAGRTSTLKVLEDLGYEAVDNLPLSLMPALLAPREAPGRIAVGVDPRTRGFATDPLADAIAELEARTDVDLRVVFLDCDDDVLIRRFTETRRRHPLATDRPIADGIAIERRMLDPVRDLATAVIDTSSSNLSEFRESLISSLALDVGRAMTVTVVSFAFRSGLPREADLVFDVRFLANPHYMPDLRPRDGRDPDVGAFVAGDPGFAPFFQSLTDLIGPLLPRYEREGKSYLTVAIGCTGGKHRSVHVAERLAEWLKSGGTPVTLRHRDLPRETGGMPST